MWYEEDYNTNIIHSNLAFPLLKKLTEVGDSNAKKVFKEEIARKLSSKTESTIKFLLEEEYYKFLTPEEFLTIFRSIDLNVQSVIKDFLIEKFNNPNTLYETRDGLFDYLEVLCSEKELLDYQNVVCKGKKAFVKNI